MNKAFHTLYQMYLRDKYNWDSIRASFINCPCVYCEKCKVRPGEIMVRYRNEK